MSARPSPILLYFTDAYVIQRDDLKGRHAAGASFLSAFIDQHAEPDIYAMCSEQEFESFSQAVKASKRRLTPRRADRSEPDTLRSRALVHLPDPMLPAEAVTRSFIGDHSYAISGLTHTISSREVIASLATYVTSPIQQWDALVCTSPAVRDAVGAIFDATESELRERIGATRFVRPMMPMIPLGIDVSRFGRNEADRKRWRDRLGFDDRTTVILFFGRLSIHAKASPFPLAQAAEIAARRQKSKLAIVWAGRFIGDFQRKVFMQTAKDMAPSVAFHHVDGGDPDVETIWSAADIFCSPSDNVQESFGLTVVEAMAAELPVIASNWDGYRGSIEDGADGILVDTIMPNESMRDIAYRYFGRMLDYDNFVGALSQICVIDVHQLAHWIGKLADDEPLRRQLGAAARRSAQQKFDWSAVMPRYFDLWREQFERLERARRDEAPPVAGAWKKFDPAHVFEGYASKHVSGDMLMIKGPFFSRWDSVNKISGLFLVGAVLVRKSEYATLKEMFSPGRPLSVAHVVKRFPPGIEQRVTRSLLWLIKIGFLQLHRDPAKPTAEAANRQSEKA